MASANNLGTAYIKIAPQMQGIQKSISDGLASIKTSSLPGAAAVGTVVAKGVSAAMNLVTSSLDGAIKRTDILNNFPRVMQNLGISTEDAQKSIDRLVEGLDGLPTALQDGASAVQRFTSRNNDVQKSTEIFLALNNAILAGGASTEIQASALEQMSQAYAKGKPDMMEWRTMMMAMPAQLNQVAKSMGLGENAADKLGESLRKGEISMDDFMSEIIKLNKQGVGNLASFEDQARGATAGIGTALTNMRNRAQKAVSSIIQSFGSKDISDAINKFSSSFAGIADWIGKNIVPIIKNILVPVLKTLLSAVKGVVEFIANNKWVQDFLVGLLATIMGYKAVKGVVSILSSFASGIASIGKTVASNIGSIGNFIAKFVEAKSAGFSFGESLQWVNANTTGLGKTLTNAHGAVGGLTSKFLGLSAAAGGVYLAIQGINALIKINEIQTTEAVTAMRNYERSHYGVKQAAESAKKAQDLLKQSVEDLKNAEDAATNAEIAAIQARQSQAYYQQEMNRLKEEGKEKTDEYRLAELEYSKAVAQETQANNELKAAQDQVAASKTQIDDLNSSNLYKANLVIGGLMREAGEYGNLAAQLDNLKTQTLTYKDEQGNMVTASLAKSQEMVEGLAEQLAQGNETWRAIVDTAKNEGISFAEACAKYGLEAGENAIGNFSQGARGNLSMVSSTGQEVIDKLKAELVKGNPAAYDAGVKTTQGYGNGLDDSSAKWGVFNKATAIVRSVIAKMKAEADIHSPSRATAELGKFMSLGLAKGIEDYASEAVSAAEDLSERTIAAMDTDLGANGMATRLAPQSGLASGLNGSGGQVIQNNEFYVDSELDVKEVSKRLGWQVATAL